MDKELINLRERILKETRKKLKESITPDIIIGHITKIVDDITKALDLLLKRFYDFLACFLPEYKLKELDYSELILKKKRKEILKLLNIKEDETLSREPSREEEEALKKLALEIERLKKLKNYYEERLTKLVKQEYPNLAKVATPKIASELIMHAGNITRLVNFPASTIQLLGAEKALFRHIKYGSKPPKYGILWKHPMVQKVKKKYQGKIARLIADKITIALKVDFFKGEYIADKLLEEINKKIKQIENGNQKDL